MEDEKHAAFIKAYDQCHDAFLHYCSAIGYGKMDTEDLVQDVLLATYQHFDKIREKGKLIHYLIRAARNRSVSLWRRRKFQPEIIDQHAERLVAKGIPPDVLPDIDLLYRALDRLPPRQKDALILYEINGFKMKEIAEIQKSSVSATKTRVSRGREKLRQLLKDRPNPKSLQQVLQTPKMLLL